MTIVDRQGNRL